MHIKYKVTVTYNFEMAAILIIVFDYTAPLADLGGAKRAMPPPPGPVKTGQKKMATVCDRKFRKSRGPPP